MAGFTKHNDIFWSRIITLSWILLNDCLQPCPFRFGDLGPLLQGGGCTIDFTAKPIADPVRIPEAIFNRINNIIRAERRR